MAGTYASQYWPIQYFDERGYRESKSQAEVKAWTYQVESYVPSTNDADHYGALFASDGGDALAPVQGALYYRFPNNGAVVELTGAGGGGGVTGVGPIQAVSTPNALSIVGTDIRAHVGSSANYGVVKGVTATPTTYGDNAGANITSNSIAIGNGAGSTLTTGTDNVILAGDVNSATAIGRIVLGNITGAVDNQLASPVTSLQFDAAFGTHTETDVLTISATGLVQATDIADITTTLAVGAVQAVSDPAALSIVGTDIRAHVGSSADYGVVKGVTAVPTAYGDGAGANMTGSSIAIGNGAAATLTTGDDNVILAGDVDSGTASGRIVLGNITGLVDDQLAAPVTSLQLSAGFGTHTETNVLSISATGLVQATDIDDITQTLAIGAVQAASDPAALSIAGSDLRAHVGSSADYGVVKGVTTVPTTYGDGAGTNMTGDSIAVGNGAAATLTTGANNVIMQGDVDSATASGRIVLGNTTGTTDNQLAAPVNSLQFNAAFASHVETDVLTISATGLVQSTPISSITQSTIFVNPIADHGAVGDGVADDTLAMSAAIDDAQNNGKYLFIPPGTFRLTSEISKTPTGLSIYGHGEGTIFIDHAGNGFSFSGGEHLQVINVTFESLDTTSSIFFLEEVENTSFIDCWYVSTEDVPTTNFLEIDSDDTYNTLILNCELEANLLLRGYVLSVLNTRFKNLTCQNRVERLLVQCCSFESVETNGAAGDEFDNITIKDSEINQNEDLDVTPVIIRNGNLVQITGNEIIGSVGQPTSYGIDIAAPDAALRKDDILIKDNVLRDFTVGGISVDPTGRVKISGNTIINNTGPGINVLTGRSDFISITHNHIISAHTESILLPLAAGISEYIITSNKLDDGITNSLTSPVKVIANNVS